MKPIVIVFSIAAGILVAQEEPPHASVSGVVINSANGEAVRKASVILRAQDQAKGTSYAAGSDGNGRFLIEDVEPGVYSISADRQGFMLETHGAPGAPPPTLKVEAGESVKKDVAIRLIPLGVITGRVLDEDGDPVRGAQVEAMTYSYQAGKKQLMNVEQVSANDKGEFRLFGLRPGAFYIRASGREIGFHMVSSSSSQMIRGKRLPGAFTSTYFPSTTDAVHASPIEVSAGAQLRGLDIRLRRETRYSVRGKLPSQKPGQNYMLQIVPRGGNNEGISSSLQMDNENFEFMDVLPGYYVVTYTLLDGDQRGYARQLVEVVNADVEAVTFNFSSLMEVSGFVRVEGTPRQPLENLRVMLQTENPSFGDRIAVVKPDGSFVIPNVTPDVYEIMVGPHPGAYLKSIRFGDQETPGGRIDLTKGSGAFTVLLGTDVGEVGGSVEKANGDPAVRVSVNLIAYGSHLGRFDLHRFGFTDDQGKFLLKNVAPGEYKIFAWEDVPVGAPQDPEFRKPFEKQAVPVKMEPNGHETVHLKAISVKASQR